MSSAININQHLSQDCLMYVMQLSGQASDARVCKLWQKLRNRFISIVADVCKNNFKIARFIPLNFDVLYPHMSLFLKLIERCCGLQWDHQVILRE